jgi:solute carrier family 25 phosphate transporter 23/24/25/41
MKLVPTFVTFVMWGGHRRISHHLQDQGGDGQMTPLLRLGAGACAGIIGMSATYPLDMVRGRLTVQGGEGQVQQYKGITDATVKIVRQVRGGGGFVAI